MSKKKVPKFNVTIRARVFAVGTVTVQAGTAEEAKQKAFDVFWNEGISMSITETDDAHDPQFIEVDPL